MICSRRKKNIIKGSLHKIKRLNFKASNFIVGYLEFSKSILVKINQHLIQIKVNIKLKFLIKVFRCQIFIVNFLVPFLKYLILAAKGIDYPCHEHGVEVTVLQRTVKVSSSGSL